MKKFIKFFIIFLSCVTCYMLYATLISAQQAINMTVSPPKQEINIKPGEETRIQIKFYNKSNEPLSGMIKKADFLVLDNIGSPTLFDTMSSNNRFAASSWLTTSEDRVTIAANNQYVSTVTIKVPKDAYPCGKYASIYFEPTPPSIGGQTINVESASTVAFKLSSLIYFNVEGECKENAIVSKIQAPNFLEFGPIPVNIEVLNRSDYHITPQVAVSTSNMLNNQTDLKVLPQVNIFPDVARSYKVELGSKWMLGQYKIALNGGYGKTGKTLTAYTYIWIFPWRISIVILLTLLVVYLLGKSIVDRMNKKSEMLEHEIEEEKAEIEKLREALKKRSD